MDILSARKKAAAGRAKAQKKPEQPSPGPGQPEQTDESPPHAEPVPAQPMPSAEVKVQQGAEIVVRESSVPVEAPLHAEPAEMQKAQEIELLSFRLGGEEYALMVDDVREVLKIVPLTLVPNAPDFIMGVMSLRGMVTPVLDLCKRLGLTPGVRDEKSRIIVVSTDEEDVGLVVDRVTGVLRISPDEIKPAPENVEQGAGYLLGIVRKGDKLHILLDLKKAIALGD